MRNKAKAGRLGVSGGPDAGRRANAPNKPNSRRARGSKGVGRGVNSCETNPISGGAGWDGPGDEGRLCKTNPISGSLAGTEGQNVRNKPNLGECRAGTSNPRSGRRQALPGANRAKQSQTWEDWDVWAKPVSVCGTASPGRGTCETKPFPPFALTFATDANTLCRRPMNRPRIRCRFIDQGDAGSTRRMRPEAPG